MIRVIQAALMAALLTGQLTTASASPKQSPHKFMMPVDQITLSKTDVEMAIKALPDLLKLTKSNAATHPGNKQKNPGKSDKYLKFVKALGALSTRSGFSDAKEMQARIETTLLAAGFINSGKTLKQIDSEIKATQNRINNNPKLSLEQKSAMLRRMHIQISMVIPSRENIATVRPYFTKIKAITGLKSPNRVH